MEVQGLATGTKTAETFLINLGAYADQSSDITTVRAGANAILNIDVLSQFAADITIEGGAGDDSVNYRDPVNSTITGPLAEAQMTSSNITFNDAVGGDDTVITGSGADVINLVSGNNSVVSGSGNDTIALGSGIDTVNAGSGDDSITATGDNRLTDADIIAAGANTAVGDTLTLKGDTTLSAANQITGFEKIVLQGSGVAAGNQYSIAIDNDNAP